MSCYVPEHSTFEDIVIDFSRRVSDVSESTGCPPCLSGASNCASFTSSADGMAALEDTDRRTQQSQDRQQQQLQQCHQVQKQQPRYEQLQQLGLIEPLPSTLLALELELTELMHLQQQLTAELAAVPVGSPLAYAAQAVLDEHSSMLMRALATKEALEKPTAAEEVQDMVAWPLLQADETGAGLLELLPAI